MASAKIRLKIPDQDLPEFRLFTPDAAGARAWVNKLPPGNTDRRVHAVTEALDLLNRTILPARERYEVLEAIRPELEALLQSLSRRYLHQPLILPAQAQRKAEWADRLCTLAANGYTIVALETVRQPQALEGVPPAQLACEAIYRALLCTGREVLQALQLYQPLHMYGWRNLHQLYALAEQQHLERLSIPDPPGAGTTIKSVYLQSVLLGCCSPHQLRQADLATLFKALGQWAEQVELDEQADNPGLFLVNLSSDQPPLYRKFYADNNLENCRFIDTGPLIETLRQLRDDCVGTAIERSSRLPANILDQLVTALGTVPNRSANRSQSSSNLTIALGLKNAHYYLAKHRTFDEVLHGEDDPAEDPKPPEFIAPDPGPDLWHRANPAEDFQHSPLLDQNKAIDLDEISHARVFRKTEVHEINVTDQAFPHFNVQLSNVSPGGYCLVWEKNVPEHLRIGDVVAIQEEHSDNWSIATTRWLSQIAGSRLLMGMELMSPQAVTFGAQIHEANGKQAAPVRALLLPEIKVVGQAATVLTPRAGFHEGQKVNLTNFKERLTIRLTRSVEATGSYSRFEFKLLRELGDILAEEGSILARDNALSLWENA